MYEFDKREKLLENEVNFRTHLIQNADEQKRRKTYEAFMAMLVHEIKTPLSIIQIAALSLGRRYDNHSTELLRINHIDKAVNDINEILFKSIQVSDIENNTLKIKNIFKKDLEFFSKKIGDIGFGLNAGDDESSDEIIYKATLTLQESPVFGLVYLISSSEYFSSWITLFIKRVNSDSVSLITFFILNK